MHGENHARPGAGLAARVRERGVDVDHRALENVGRGALDRHVDRGALGRHADLAVAAVQLGHQPPPPEHGFHYSSPPRFLDGRVDVAAHLGEAGEVGVDERLRRFLGHADVLRQRERGFAVEQCVVDDLGAAPQFVLAETAVGAEHLERGAIVDVLAAAERLDQRVLARQVREHAQLDLRVVGRDEHVSRRGDERAAD